MPKKLYIETVGCQMNLLDSELVVASLRKEGYELTNKATDADTILFNTCSVRQHAEDKIYSALGRIKNLKNEHPNTIIGVLGCMAQKDQKLIFQRAKYVDLIVGPGQLHQVPSLIKEIERDRKPRMEVSLGRKDGTQTTIARSHESFDPLRDPTMRPTPHQAYIRIMIGCDKFCTYCIVPSVRGPEQSRSPLEIIAEAKQLASEGCKEVILLGQTVNSYEHREGGKTWRLADLLLSISNIEAIRRIKFVTSYPKDMTNELLTAVRDLPKCSKYLHVPAQHGSDAVLKRMKRGYTIAEYREMHTRAKELIPGLAISSDFIVGFCGETDAEFQTSCDLVREMRFKNSFIFKYSERPGTVGADRFPDDIPDEVKRKRNNELLAIQNEISEADNIAFIGQETEILVEGASKAEEKRRQHEEENAAQNGQEKTNEQGERPSLQLTGRTPCDRIVVFDGNPRQIGQILPITIYDANAHTLFGEVITHHVGPEVHTLEV